jgi:hypothetical protein
MATAHFGEDRLIPLRSKFLEPVALLACGWIRRRLTSQWEPFAKRKEYVGQASRRLYLALPTFFPL